MQRGNIKALELRHLRAFNTVVRTGSFSVAAKNLYITQPALSKIVKSLEKVLEIQLFMRSTRPIKLTPAGEVFRKHSNTILRQTEIAFRDIKGISRGYRGLLRIALSDDVNMAAMSDMFAAFREEAPDIEIQFIECNLSVQLAGIRSGEFDAGFARYPVFDNDIHFLLAYQEELVAVLPKRHTLLNQTRINLKEFLKHLLIFYHPRQAEGSYLQMSQKIRLEESKADVVQYAKTFEFMLSMVAAGFGISMMGCSRREVAHMVNVATRDFSEPLTLDTYLLYPDHPSDSLKQLILRTKSFCHCIKATN